MPPQVNPADFVLDLLNIDFASADQEGARLRLEEMHKGWVESPENKSTGTQIAETNREPKEEGLRAEKFSRANFFTVVLALVHRSWIKSYRDVVAYGVRIAMYTGKSFRP